MKSFIRKIPLCLYVVFGFSLASPAQELSKVGVSPFKIHGPSEVQYLSKAAQESLINNLIQQNYHVLPINSMLPSNLQKKPTKYQDYTVLVSGILNVVGDSYTGRIFWVDHLNQKGEKVLSVAPLSQLLSNIAQFKAPAWQANEVVPTTSSNSKPQASQPVKEVPRELPKPSKSKLETVDLKPNGLSPNLRGYTSISKRLPYAIRGMAFGDLDGDGKKELVTTSKDKLYIYRWNQGQVQKLGEYSGKKLDYFVKVSLFQKSPEEPVFIALTNLREDRASSKILSFEQGALVVQQENIPYQLDVKKIDGRDQLLGTTYSASTTVNPAVFYLTWEGHQLEAQQRVDLPWNTRIYSYDLLSIGSQSGAEGLVMVTPNGNLRYYQKKQGKFKKVWSSRPVYGKTGNFVPAKQRDVFNEVIQSYYGVPIGVYSLGSFGAPEIVVAKNNSVVKGVVGRRPFVTDGQLFRLRWDEMGFAEVWASKKVDGSIQDYLVTQQNGQTKIMAAVFLKPLGAFSGDKVKESVILVYDVH